MKNITIILISILISVSLVGCGEPDMEGIILEINEKTVLVAENLSLDRYDEIRDEPSSTSKIISGVEEEVRNTGGDISLIDLNYDNADEFEVGNEVIIWIDGGLNESFPAQAKAKKISLKK